MEEQDVLILEEVSKKFCKNLRLSLFYGLVDSFLPPKVFKKQNNSLRKGEFWAIKNLSFRLKRGDILGVWGKNGAGKTTLMKLISGIYPLSEGKIILNGAVHQVFAKTTGMNRYYTARQNIYIRCAMHGFNRTETDKILQQIIEFSELNEFLNLPLGNYSSGMRARLSFSILAHLPSDILIADEALSVGDEAFREKCFHKIKELAKTRAIIYVSHHREALEKICTKLLVLHKGQTTYFGNFSAEIFQQLESNTQ